MSSPVRIEAKTDNHVARVTISSDKGVNVFGSRELERLMDVLRPLEENRHVRVVLFRGQGKAFLAGANIKEMTGFDPVAARVFGQTGHRAYDAVASLHPITIACIHGAALGGGCELALACDFRVAASEAMIGLPECTLGLIPGWGGTQRLPRLVGLAVARRMLFSGKPLSAKEALEVGLVDRVVETADQLEPAAMELFREMTRGGPEAIAHIKSALRTGDELSAFAECFSTAEHNEGMAAFVEKRPARWMEM